MEKTEEHHNKEYAVSFLNNVIMKHIYVMPQLKLLKYANKLGVIFLSNTKVITSIKNMGISSVT